MSLEIEKIIKIIILVVVLVVVVLSLAILWTNYIKPYLEDLGKAETAGIKTSIFLPVLMFSKGRRANYQKVFKLFSNR